MPRSEPHAAAVFMGCRMQCMLLLTLVTCGSAVFAQGTKADYERSARLRRETGNKVYRNDVKVHWLPDGLWYRVTTGPDTYEFVRVKFANGRREPDFDHAKLAASLQQAGLRDVRPDGLPLGGLELSADGASISFQAGAKGWKYDLTTLELSPAEIARPSALRPLSEMPTGSRRTGESTTLTVRNRTGGEVQLWWLSTNNERVRYETIAAGDTFERQTYAGHVWLVTDAAGKPLAWYEARESDNVFEVDGTVPESEEVKPPRDERPVVPRRARRNGFSPDGKWRAVVRDHNLHLEESATQQIRAITNDGTASEAYHDLFWSPDSTHVAAIRISEVPTREIHLIESSPKDQLQPKLHTLEYAKPGDSVSQRSMVIFDLEQQRLIPISQELFSNQWSLSEFQWISNSKEFSFLFNQRGHQLLRVVALDAETGESRTVVEERSATFVDYSQKTYLHWLKHTGELIWASERDGWNHLYLYDMATGTVKNQITRGPWVIRGVERVDESNRQIWFRAGGILKKQDPYHVHSARVNLDGSGLTVLTEGDGTHTVEFAPDREYFVDTWSRVDQPPVRELRRTEDGQRVCELERADWTALLQTGWQAPERFVAQGRDGETNIYGLIYRPTNFDPTRNYPVIESIYAGPHGAHVPKSFRAWSGQRELAELGFVVVQIDGMGTNWRSKAFHDVCWKNLKDAGFPDRIAWFKAAAATRPWMDLSRVGIYGGSAGGQNTLAGLLHYGDFYQVGVADCGCHDNRMDKIWWNEAWMGWPVDASYVENSNVTHAGKLSGKLLLVFGELDRNVDPASTLQVVHALEQANKDFDLLLMTGTGHGAAETPYASRRRMDFFVRHLWGQEPRR